MRSIFIRSLCQKILIYLEIKKSLLKGFAPCLYKGDPQNSFELRTFENLMQGICHFQILEFIKQISKCTCIGTSWEKGIVNLFGSTINLSICSMISLLGCHHRQCQTPLMYWHDMMGPPYETTYSRQVGYISHPSYSKVKGWAVQKKHLQGIN